jgi:hypothetical protein
VINNNQRNKLEKKLMFILVYYKKKCFEWSALALPTTSIRLKTSV